MNEMNTSSYKVDFNYGT